MKEKIEIGDRVNVYFIGADAIFDCEVLYTPCATGDSWRLKSKKGEIIYVQMYETIELLAKPRAGGVI